MQDRTPDEFGAVHVALLVVLLKLYAWVQSGDGILTYEERIPALEAVSCARTVQRWLRRLLPDTGRLESALRTATIERSEPHPIENLFPGGLSPPGAGRRRRWKDPEAIYRLQTGLAYLVDGAVALSTSVTVLLAEAHRRLDGPLGTPRS